MIEHQCNDGLNWYWYVNHKHKEVGSDWMYCHYCYPGSDGWPEYEEMLGWERIDYQEAIKLMEQGYKQTYL